ncbi:MAG: DUF1552 domain-containing protein [Verrucomicrobiota bacterium]
MSTITLKQHLSRRTFLRAAGISMALPWLEAMSPALTRAANIATPRRFVSVSNDLGFHGPFLFPEQAGRDYEPTRYLKPIADMKEHFTVFSGVSHPGVTRGHSADVCILTAQPNISGANFRNRISLDQLMARRLGSETRFPSLSLTASGPGSMSTSFTELGAMIAPEDSPENVFAKMFLEESPTARQENMRRMQEGKSIMDIVGADAKAMQRRLGSGDKEKLDAFFTSVRDLEKTIQANEAWANRPKPKVTATAPKFPADRNDVIGRQSAMMDVIFLALQTDSTRFITLHTGGGGGKIPLPGVEEAYHNLSHHGQDPNKIAQLGTIEEAQMAAWGQFIRRLQKTQDGDATLLDRSMVLLTSNLGNASAHDTKNMPVVFAGGGFKHGQHLAFDRKDNYPLPNLYVSMLQRLGLPIDKFATGTSTMSGLEMS